MAEGLGSVRGRGMRHHSLKIETVWVFGFYTPRILNLK